MRTSDPDRLAAAAKRAVDQNGGLVIAVPINSDDYTRMF
jgi:hypothetical protein